MRKIGLIGLMWLIFWGSVYFGFGSGLVGWFAVTLAADYLGQGSIGFLLVLLIAITFFPTALVILIYKLYFRVTNRFLVINLLFLVGAYWVFALWGFSRWS